MWHFFCFFFFFKQKTAYEMRISDWSSDVCSSDLGLLPAGQLYRIQTGEELGQPFETCLVLLRKQESRGAGDSARHPGLLLSQEHYSTKRLRSVLRAMLASCLST